MIRVVGPGAMGCLLAARLAAAGEPVTLVCRSEGRAALLRASGVTVLPLGGGPPLAPALTIAGAPPPGEGLTFLCVKAPATAAAVAPLASTQGPVAVLQNGIGRFEEVGNLLGDRGRVVGVLTTEGATRTAPGEVRHAGAGETLVGALDFATGAGAEAVREALERAGFNCKRVKSLQAAVWEKAMVNAAINALTGLLDRPNGALLEVGPAGALADNAAEEAATVAAALGLPGDWSAGRARARWRAVAEATRENVSSTLADLRRGQKTEVFAINGAVAQTARELGLSACVNETLDRLVAAREALI